MADSETPASPPAGNQGVQLGIGTLIIIAVIVSMCSGSGDVKQLRGDIDRLKQQNTEINQKLDRLLEKDSPAQSAPADSTGQ
jgi:outer membrane murein-binding lipoprotein Lpp